MIIGVLASAVAISGMAFGALPGATTTAARTATATVVAVSPSAGPANQSVEVVVTVSAGSGEPRGSVVLLDGATVVARGLRVVDGTASVSTNALGPGPHSLTAEFTAPAGFGHSTSAPARAHFGTTAPAQAGVAVTIPSGTLTLTSTRRPGSRSIDVTVTDTRAGNLGFTAAVVAHQDPAGRSGSTVGLSQVTARQVPGNALRARDVRVADVPPNALRRGGPRTFARLPASLSTGSVRLHTMLDVVGSRSRTRIDRAADTLTFTAF